MADPRFTFIAGGDDFLVDRAGQAAFAEAAEGLDDMSREVIEGFAANADDVARAISRFREAAQTLGLFGGAKAVWLRGLSFLAATQDAPKESVTEAIEALKAALGAVDPGSVRVVVTAAPFDLRRKTLVEFLQTGGRWVHLMTGEKDDRRASLARFALEEARALGVQIDAAATERLVELAGTSTRFLAHELAKLAAYADGAVIDEDAVRLLTPNFAEGDFFEAAEAFFSSKLDWACDALRRHFFAGHEARPLLSTLQNRTRLMLQLRVLQDEAGGDAAVSRRVLEAAARRHGPAFAGAEKGSYNVFSQNPWYVERIARDAARFRLKRLVELQLRLVELFGRLHDRGVDEEAAFRGLAVWLHTAET